MFASAHVGQSIGGCRNAQDALSLDKLSRRDVKIRVVNCNVARDSGLTSRTADVHVRPPAFGRVEVGQRLKVHRTRNTTGRVGRVCTYLCFGHVTWQWTNAAGRQQPYASRPKAMVSETSTRNTFSKCIVDLPTLHPLYCFSSSHCALAPWNTSQYLTQALGRSALTGRASQSTWHRRRMRPRRWPHRRPTLPPHNCPTNAEALRLIQT